MRALLSRLMGVDPRLQRAEHEHRLRVVELEQANAQLKHLQERLAEVGQQSQLAETELAETIDVVDEVSQSRSFHLGLELSDAAPRRT